MQGGAVGHGARERALAAFAALSWALGLAACSPSQPLACPSSSSGSSACPSLDGVTSFCTWSEWGCAPEPACGGYFLVLSYGVDARFTYYYSAETGRFVGTIEESLGGGNPRCLAGPPSFLVPSGCAVDTVAACAPPPREGGTGPSDAGPDAPFSPPSPSSSPSTQPLAFPPLPPR
jgi:hypothetical protein